jgi:MOSC domain-containing protein YiiM
MPTRDAHLLSVNVGAVREVEWRGEMVRTGIWKQSVGEDPVAVRGVNLDGDDQADRRVHGGPDKAVYAYAIEDYEEWERDGLDTSPGLFGENLTTVGMDLGAARVGERWSVGTAVLEVAQPRLPCFKLGIRLGDAGFPRRFLAMGRLGAYLRIVQSGDLQAGDPIRVLDRPSHGTSLARVAAALRDPTAAAAVLATPKLPESWRRMLGRRDHLDEDLT